jgi:hypothetical protein
MAAVSQSPSVTPSVSSTSSASLAKPATREHQGFTFDDFIDIINPLQHIPVVSTLYRRLTGDKMGPTAEIAGGALFGGLLGAVGSIADVLWTQATGRDFGNSVMAWLGLEGKASTTQFAKAQPSPASADPEITSATTPELATVEVSPLTDLQIPTPALPARSVPEPDMPALVEAIEKQGVDRAVALRAAVAYRNAIGLELLSNMSSEPTF